MEYITGEVMQLRGGFTTRNPLLGRIPEFDEKSRQFQMRALMSPEQLSTLRSHTWAIRLLLDQGVRLPVSRWDPSACTGFSSTYDLAAYPAPVTLPNKMPFTNEFAFQLYQ